MKENFEVGQIVKAKKNIDLRIEKNYRGKIVQLQRDNFLGVEWFKYIDGHNCEGLGKMGFCWYVLDYYVSIDSDQLEFDF